MSDHASEESTSQMVIIVGFGVPVTVRSGPTTSSETSSDIRIRLAALDSPAQIPLDVDPRYDFDADYYRLSTYADPLGEF